jgi:hypothetical protein
VDVEIAKDTEEATVVPLEAVFRESSAKDPFVFVRSGSSWERREVQLGLANALVAVVRSGLRPGEVVAAEYPPPDKTR